MASSRSRIPALSEQHVLDNVQLHLLAPADLQHVEDAVIPRCDATVSELRQLLVLCRQIPDWRTKKGRDYPLHCLLAIMVMATLSGIVRGQRDLAAFAAKLTQFQLRALGSYRKRSGARDYPKETTFKDFHDAMNRFNHRLAFATITARRN